MGTTRGFYSWLLEQSDRDDPIGDLAQDVKKVRDVPNDSDTKDNWLAYLRHKSACPVAMKTMGDRPQLIINYTTQRYNGDAQLGGGIAGNVVVALTPAVAAKMGILNKVESAGANGVAPLPGSFLMNLGEGGGSLYDPDNLKPPRP